MLGRRDFLRGVLLTGISGLTSCVSVPSGPVLKASPETLPKKLIKALPSPWRYEALKPSREDDPFLSALEGRADLIALGDGWLSELSPTKLKFITFPDFVSLFDAQAENFMKSINANFAGKILPIASSPWVLLFRNGDKWLNKAEQGWEILLEPSLKRKIVLPDSPRLVMSLADRMSINNSLDTLLNHTLAFDDRNVFNWLLKGKGEVAVVPLHRCMPYLRRDPRLAVSLPNSGAPLNWILLVQPIKSRNSFPKEWIKKSLTPQLLANSLLEGWIPPVRRDLFADTFAKIPKKFRKFLFPSKRIWSNCWSLAPLSLAQEDELEERFNSLIP